MSRVPVSGKEYMPRQELRPGDINVNSTLDWFNFINFTTPPINASQEQASHAVHQDNNEQGSSNDNSAHNVHPAQRGDVPNDQYQSFTQGIALSKPSQANMNLHVPPQRIKLPQHSPPHLSPQQQAQPQRYAYPPPLQSAQINASSQGPSPYSPMDSVAHDKGKSPAKSRSHSSHSVPRSLPQTDSGNSVGGPNQENGLSLDPSAFPEYLIFKYPPALTNNVLGFPTFPPGCEVWNGLTGPPIFGSDVGQPAPVGTPTSIGTAATNWAQSSQEQGLCNGSDNNDWCQGAKQSGPGMATNTGFGMRGQIGMVYVNPNPSPSIIHPRHQQASLSGFPKQQPSSTSSSPDQGSGKPDNKRANFSIQSPRRDASTHQAHGHGHGPPTASLTPFQPHPQIPNTHPTPSPLTSSHLSSSSTMPTSAILPSHSVYSPNASIQQAAHHPDFSNVGYMPMSNNTSTGNVNIASSSRLPYAPSRSSQPFMQGSMPSAPQMMQDGPGLYSMTGFDMLGVLGRVAARKNPSTVLGPVDMSCSFLVVDIRRYDSPIVYASPTFSKLTGYELPQILGKNCRFLQSPDGEVTKGSKRDFTDNEAVSLLRRSLDAGKECQTSLINYKRGGEPFINLVTVVPIPWDGIDIVYHVGFQIDLVEQPNRILKNMRDGTYIMDYTFSMAPEKPLQIGDKEALPGLSAEVLDVMGTRVAGVGIGSDSEEAGRMEWLKMVLDNTDDFVHALSLKGFFQFCSNSVRKLLGYEPEDLLNKNISEFAHPVDIVPLIRALKDSTQTIGGSQQPRPVSLTFRIRKKHAGYVWIESVGRLVVEVGKGRKAVILSGRIRGVPLLTWKTVGIHGGLTEKEFWGKISFQGLLLHLTSGVEQILGHTVSDALGHSLFSFLPGGGNGPPSAETLHKDLGTLSPAATIANAIHQVLQGQTISIGQKMVHRSGRMIDMLLIIYAPDQIEENMSSMVAESDDDTSVESKSTAYITDSIKPTNLTVQFKVVTPPLSTPENATISVLTNARPLVHPPMENVFRELETGRDTSWQYELHRLKMANRKLKEDIAAITAKGAGKKRKRMGEVGGQGYRRNSLPINGFGMVGDK
ncbi:hypothetical protein L204_102741 [Cryptococcus depauperatus]|nr:hypothetical protein L204_00509 [Cryptococcus depauperatus CBS 7855]